MEDLLVLTIIIVVIAAFLFYCIAAVEFSKIAELKGYPEKKKVSLWFCLLVPFAGYLYVCALPDKGNKEIISNTNEVETSVQEIHEEKPEDQEQLPQL